MTERQQSGKEKRFCMDKIDVSMEWLARVNSLLTFLEQQHSSIMDQINELEEIKDLGYQARRFYEGKKR
jgi:hypothetical protein